jgi:hypothetical protein
MTDPKDINRHDQEDAEVRQVARRVAIYIDELTKNSGGLEGIIIRREEIMQLAAQYQTSLISNRQAEEEE